MSLRLQQSSALPEKTPLYILPVKLLLNSGRELLIELLQIRKADDQRVPLWPDQFFSIPQVLDLPIAVLEPGSDSGKRFTVTHQAATEYFGIQERRQRKGSLTFRHPTVPCKAFFQQYFFFHPLATSALCTPQHRHTGFTFHTAGELSQCQTKFYLRFNNGSAPANKVLFPPGDANGFLI